MSTLTLTNYSRKGIHAYLAPLTVRKGDLHRERFINGKPVDKDLYYKGKSVEVTFDLSSLPNGLYEWSEYDRVTYKKASGFVNIENGEITEDLSKDEVLQLLAPLPELPVLNGTPKQVSWAEDIRSRAIRSGKVSLEDASKETSAKYWIEHRDEF